MNLTRPRSAVKLGLLALITLSAAGWAWAKGPKARVVGAVYAMTNDPTGNAVAIFQRTSDGLIKPLGTVPTGGLGIGDGADGEGMRSQSALILSPDNRYLYAANAGSGDITVFAVKPNGLMFLQRIASGGSSPISLTIHANALYVLNYDRLATTPDSGSITGFQVRANGRLVPISGSTRPLSGAGTDPGQVAFSPDGRLLAVTERATGQILLYKVGRDGRTSEAFVAPARAPSPFTMAFGTGGVLVVSDEFDDTAGQGAASSFVASIDASLRPESGPVADFQDGPGYVTVTRDGTVAYVANPNTAVISGFLIDADGALRRLDTNGTTATTGGMKPRDMALSNDGRYLYVLNSGSGTIAGYAIQVDGRLKPLGLSGMLPAPGSNGLAAR